MIRRPPRSTQSSSSAASDVYKRQVVYCLEETDNGKDLQKLLIDPELNVTVSDGNICGTPVKKLTAAGFRQLDTHIEKESEALYHVWKKPEFEKAELSYIPYYTWANLSLIHI